MGKIIIKSIILAAVLSLIAIQADPLDYYPHGSTNNIGCDSCHYVYGEEPSLLPPWTDHVPQDIDDTQYNTLCWSCHNDIEAPYLKTHSSLQIDNDYGDWTIECRTCHDPHTQMQIKTFGNSSHVYSGTSTDVTATILTETGAGWTANAYQGLVLIPNVERSSRYQYGYKITGNTADTITVEGPVNLSRVSIGDTFAVIYGKLVKSTIVLDNIIDPTPPKTGSKTVRFFNNAGTNSFADNNTTRDGVCEVCHTFTAHFRNDGTGSDQLHTNMNSPAETDCTTCHKHVNGFAGMGGGAHETHVIDPAGPQLACADCHGANPPPLLADGQNMTNSTVCNNCHSTDGAATAKTYWPDDPDTWVSTEGESSFCGGCHDETPGNSNKNGTGDDAPNIAGDNSTYGYFVTGHGKPSGTYARLSWQAVSASGNPAANRACNDCHDLTITHYNSGNSRLKTGYENDADNSNCKQCHDPGTAAQGDPLWYTTYVDYQNSAHSGKKCSDCHNVHGSSGAYSAMTIAGQENLCYQCHTDGVVQNNAVSGSTVADDIQDAFSLGNTHDLGTSFSIDAENYTLECVSCHNVHLITGKYWEADLDKTPVTLFSNNTALWGNDSIEKMDYYADTGKYQTPGGSSHVFDGSQLPDYPTFCLDCHQNAIGAIEAKDWTGDAHGKKVAGMSGLGRSYTRSYRCPNGGTICGRAYNWGDDECSGTEEDCWPVIPKGAGYNAFVKGGYKQTERSAGLNYVMSCTDCHEAHGSNNYSMLRKSLNAGTDGTEYILSNNQSDWHALFQGGDPEGLCGSCHAGYWLSKEHMFWHNQDGTCSACSGTNPQHLDLGGAGGPGGPYNGMGAFTCTGVCHTTEYGKGDEFTSWHVDATFHKNRKAQQGDAATDPADYSDDLVVDYRFENNLEDSHMWNLHGHFANGSGSYVTGKIGNAVQVNDNPIEVGADNAVWDSTNLGITGNTSKLTEMKYNMALEAWVYPTSDPSDGRERKIMAKHNYWDGGYAFVLRAIDGEYRAGLITNMELGGPDTTVWDGDCNGLRGAYSSAAIPLNQWTHVATTFDTSGPDADTGDLSVGRIRIYVNGEDVTTSELFSGNPCWAQPQTGEDYMTPYVDMPSKNPSECSWCATALSVGGLNWSAPNDNFVGRLDEVKVWNVTKDISYFDSRIPPSITTVEGLASYDELYVEFSEGAYADSNGTGDLQLSDFILADSDDGRTILSVQHSAGSSTAVLTLSSALDSTSDLGVDTLALASDSAYDEYGDVAGFTDEVTITAMPSPTMTSVEGGTGSSKILVTFSDNVYTDTGMNGPLVPADFVLTDSDNGRTITAVDHTAGAKTAILTLSSAMDANDDFLVDTVAAAAGSVFDGDDYPAGITPVAITEQPPVTILAVTGQAGYDRLEVRFSGTVYAETGATGSLQPGDFVLTDSDNGRTIISVDHSPGVDSNLTGEDIAMLTLSSALDSTNDIDVDTVAANGIYNFMDTAVDTTPVTVTEMPAASIESVEGFVGGDNLKVTFSHWVYGDMGETGTIEPADFTLTDAGGNNPRTITAVQHGAGDSYAFITMSAPLAAGDVDTDTITAVTASIFNSVDHPVDSTAVTISAQAAPTITSVEGTVGLDEILVLFSEAVYADTGQSGALQASDFSLTDADNGRTIASVTHTAGSASAILALSSVIDSSADIDTDTLAANGIYNKMDNPVDTAPVTLTGNNCPVGGSRFDFSEGAGSSTTDDDTGLLTGTIYDPAQSMRGDGLYWGDDDESVLTYMEASNNTQCLKSPRTLTLETRIYFDNVDLDFVDTTPANGIDDDYDAGLTEDPVNWCCSKNGDGRNTTGTRIAERRNTWQFTVFRGNWTGLDEDPTNPDRARVIFKYKVTDRGTCDGTYPLDSTGEGSPVNGAWYKQISSDIENYPIVSGHWYKIRIVYNTDKARLAVDIFADDEGTDGSGAGELWTGYKNIAKPDPEDSSACKWAAIPGLVMQTPDYSLNIGENWKHAPANPDANDAQGHYNNVTLKGKMDWFVWKPVVDYSGLDDPPY